LSLLPPVSRWSSRPSHVLAAALGGLVVTTFPISVFSLALPQLEHEFRASLDAVTWVITAPLLGFAIALPALGRISDLFGHRRVYLAGTCGAGVFAFLSALAPTLSSLIVFRTLGQVTGAATTPASLAMIAAVYPPDRRLRIMGLWSLAAAGSPVVGIVAGGPLIQAFGWRSIFLIQGFLSVPAICYAWLVLPKGTARNRAKIDVWGLAILAVALTAGMVALELLPQRGALLWVIPSAVACVAGFAAFFAVEKRAASPVLPLEMLRIRNFCAPTITQALSTFAYMGGYILTPLLLETQFGMSVSRASLILLARPIAFCIGAPVTSRMSMLTPRRAAIGGTALMAIALPVFALGAGLLSLSLVMAGNVLAGFGNGMSQPALTTAVVNAVSADRHATASGFMQMMGQVGAVAGIAVAGAIVAAGAGTGRFAHRISHRGHSGVPGFRDGLVHRVLAHAAGRTHRAAVGSGDGERASLTGRPGPAGQARSGATGSLRWANPRDP
jgi:MFS family permease